MRTIHRSHGPRRGARHVWLAGLLALLLAACGAVPNDGAAGVGAADPPIHGSGGVEVELELPPERGDGVIESLHDVRIRLVNRSEDTIRLVLPGDGSNVGWRTPRVGWSVLPEGSDETRPDVPVLDRTLRCGNLNWIQASEVVELAPGESVAVECYFGGRPRLARGNHRIAFYYRNDPALGASGLAPRTPEVDELLRSTTHCETWSDELLVTRR